MRHHTLIAATALSLAVLGSSFSAAQAAPDPATRGDLLHRPDVAEALHADGPVTARQGRGDAATGCPPAPARPG